MAVTLDDVGARASRPPVPTAARPRDREADLDLCRATLRDGSKSFFAASLMLPRRVRDPAAAVYAFCRVADDAVDAGGGSEATIALLESRLDRAFAGRPFDHAIDRALADAVAEHELPRAPFDALLEGFRWDVESRRYADVDALGAYAVRVAGAIGVTMAWLMDVRDRRVLYRACEMGVAMQLTNIARDVGEDARAGRLYLPVDWLEGAGIDPDRFLERPTFDPRLASVVRRLLAHARAVYERADGGVGALPPDCRVAIRAARLVYSDIGGAIERAGWNSVDARHGTGRRRKVLLLARALRAAVAPRRTRLAARPDEEVRALVERSMIPPR